jgi:hypothetical protein
LNISVLALWSLSGNPQFPAPTSNDGAGNVVWDSGDIAAFEALWTAARANGWVTSTAALPTANWSAMASTPIGSRYVPALSDPLFDL